MQREVRVGFQRLWMLWVAAAVLALGSPLSYSADEPPPAGRPWLVLSAASFDQLQSHLDAMLTAADRPELAEILARRLKGWRDLKGIDRTRPVGLVRFWPTSPEATSEEVLFIPAGERGEFLRTVTFDTVPFARKTADHYTIDRPGAPYHVLFRKDVGWMGDRPATLQTCSGMLGEWTAELVQKHDLGVLWDLRQVPEPQRQLAAEDWGRHLMPLLQRRDDESAEVFRLRRAWMDPLVLSGAHAIEQTRRMVLRLKFDAERSTLTVDLQVFAEPKSAWAEQLARWRPVRSPWQDLAQAKDARSGGLITGVPGFGAADAGEAATGQIAWQMFGDSLAERTLVLALSDSPVQEQPRTLGTEGSLSFERVAIPDVPVWVRSWIGGYHEAWLVREKKTVWLAFGPPELARRRLDAALAPGDGHATRTPVCLSARIPLRDCLAAMPWFDRYWADEQVRGVEDRVEITVAPFAEGLQVRAVLPIGVLRLMGGVLADDLAQEAASLIFAPGDATDE
jgi:hypothetical protein